MSDLPIGSNYQVVMIHPKVLNNLDKIKNNKEENKKPDNPKALTNSLDSMSATMRAKVEMQKKQDEYNKKLQIAATIIKEQMPYADEDEIREQAEEMVENGAYDEIVQNAEVNIKETLAAAIEKIIEKKKPQTISIDELEASIDKPEGEK